MTISTDLYILICWFRCLNVKDTSAKERHICCLINGISGPFGRLEQSKEDGVLRR